MQPYLQRAVALLHSFWWEEADAAFADVLNRVTRTAPSPRGSATVAIGNPFSSGATPVSAQKALAAIERGRAIGAKTERERGYIEAVAALLTSVSPSVHTMHVCARSRMRSMPGAEISGGRRDADLLRAILTRGVAD